jgi:hypothetical protein
MKNMTPKVFRKKVILAAAFAAMIAAVAVGLVASTTSAAGSQASQHSKAQLQPQSSDLNFTLNDGAWKNLEEFLKADAPAKAENITATSKGWAFQRIDNETIKQYAVEINLTLEVGPKKGSMISIVNVTGSVSISSTTYNAVYRIESGKGVIETKKNAVLISSEGINGESKVTLKAEATYFWWGGKTFACRALLQQAGEKPMLLLLRYGVAKVQ